MIIETERLILRPMVMDDATDVFDYSKQANVGPNAGWAPHKTIDETKEIMEMVFVGQRGVFGIVSKESGKVIGSVGIIDDRKRENDRAGMLGYAIGEEHWGKGYMTEAAKAVVKFGFSDLELDIISCYCYPDNYRSQRVIEKCGFKPEGTLRLCEKLFNGEVKDNLCFSLTRGEYCEK